MDQWRPEDWAVFVAAMVSLVGAIAAAAVKIILAIHGVQDKVDKLQTDINGHVEELMKSKTALAHAEGVEAGRGQAVVPIVAKPVELSSTPNHPTENGPRTEDK